MPKIPKIDAFPSKPGVYWMKGASGEVLYVGKAKNLRARVRSYFQKKSKDRFQIDFLMRKTKDIDFLVTDTEKEALLLENTLIKKHQPRYNVFLKDDKNFASLRLSSHPFPGLYVTRQIKKDGSIYFGPYASAGGLRQTLDWLTRYFKLRTCADHEFANRSRPCLEYDIGRCSGPCVGLVSKEVYGAQVEEAKLFLEGKSKELLKKLKNKMELVSQEERFEEAARIRDLIFYVQETLEKQKVVHHDGADYDAIGFAKGETRFVFFVMVIRKGILCDRQRFVFPRTVDVVGESLPHFLLQHYGDVLDIPPKILLPETLEDLSALEEILSERRGSGVTLTFPKKGEAARMVILSSSNAQEWIANRIEKVELIEKNLKVKLGLNELPKIIECVDISNLQGAAAVGSLVCFEEGNPLKNRYRKFKIRLVQGPNDYAMMYEVLNRRFRRALEWPLPDLLLVDGGKGQLSVALKALADLGLHPLPVAAIAKAKKGEASDKIYLPGRKNPVKFRPNSPELLYLMRIRDEAHRFGITYHRERRSKM